MPDPGESETEQEFISRCIPKVLEDGGAKDEKQAAAICYSKWRDANQEKSVDVLVMHGSEVKALGEGRVGGYLVRFTTPEEPDLTGDYFDAATDYGLADKTAVYYAHGFDQALKRRRLGMGTLKADDVGVWIEAQLDMRDEYERAVYGLAVRDKLGWSSGTAPHLVEREQKGEAFHITSWPLGLDASLTPTPAEPKNMALPLKAWLSTVSLEALAEVDVATSTDSAGTIPEYTTTNTKLTGLESPITTEVRQMDENEVKAIVEATVGAATKAFWDAQPDPVKPMGYIVEDEADRALKGNPWKSLGELAQATIVAARAPTQADKRLLPIKDADGYAIPAAFIRSATKVATGLGEDLGAIGGFLVGTDQGGELPARTWGNGQIVSRIALDTVSAGSNGMTYYGANETTRVDGGRHGGVLGYWITEGTAKTPSNPTFRQIQLRLHKACALVYATDELLNDSNALGSYLTRIYTDELTFLVEHAIVNGPGAGQPLGILTAPCLVTVAAEPAQAITTIVTNNILNMWSRRYTGVNDYVWLVNQDTLPQLWRLSLPVGTGGQLVWTPPGGLSGSPYGTIFGRPVIECEYCATLGAVGDIVLAAFSQYQGIQKGGVEAASSIHFVFDHDETTFRFVYRFDGQPTWAAAVTPHSGSANTVSPFVTLAGRP